MKKQRSIIKINAMHGSLFIKKLIYICLAMLNIVTKTAFPNDIIN